MAAILNNALKEAIFFLIQKVSKMLFGDHKPMIRCQDHHN